MQAIVIPKAMENMENCYICRFMRCQPMKIEEWIALLCKWKIKVIYSLITKDKEMRNRSGLVLYYNEILHSIIYNKYIFNKVSLNQNT